MHLYINCFVVSTLQRMFQIHLLRRSWNILCNVLTTKQLIYKCMEHFYKAGQISFKLYSVLKCTEKIQVAGTNNCDTIHEKVPNLSSVSSEISLKGGRGQFLPQKIYLFIGMTN